MLRPIANLGNPPSPPVLLLTQVNEVYDTIETTQFNRDEIEAVPTENALVFRLKEAPEHLWFSIRPIGTSAFDVWFAPGAKTAKENANPRTWPRVREYVRDWLGYVSRELAEIERARAGSGKAPDWALAELPPDYVELVAQIEALQGRERRLRRMSGLMWETGEPLNKLVRDTFRELGYSADMTDPGATFDVLVPLPEGRLLIEVTGIEGHIHKGSKKIAQVLSTRQNVASAEDRVCLAVNSHRARPVAERDPRDLITKEASELLVGLNAVVFTTVDLFRLWVAARSDETVGNRVIESLLVAPPGLARLP